ncbi:regulator of Vps4 activity in the MVB pathway-domain-containing protein [Phycomyces blakesleeanus]
MFAPTRLKVQLKLAINRLKMLQAKKNSLNQHQRREIATLLEKGKVESARIRVEHIIREDLLMEAMEILELYCDLLLARFGLIEQYRQASFHPLLCYTMVCDPGISEAVHTIIWATPRADEVKELGVVRDQLAFRFGKEFVLSALDNTENQVNPRVISKMQVNAPDAFLVERYLEEIAKSYDVGWVSDVLAREQTYNDGDFDDNDDDDTPSGGIAEKVHQEAEREPPVLATPRTQTQLPIARSPSPTFDLPEIPTNLPLKKPINTSPASKPAADSFDDLAKRLEALKKR